MWRMLQHDKPDDYVLAMGETHTVREFVKLAFDHVNIEIERQGTGIDEKGIDKATGKVLIEVDARYFRPAEVQRLLGDATKARTVLGWKPTYTLEEMVKEMMEEDIMHFLKEDILKKNGYKILKPQE